MDPPSSEQVGSFPRVPYIYAIISSFIVDGRYRIIDIIEAHKQPACKFKSTTDTIYRVFHDFRA